jgi:hypothetical protein
MVLAMMITNVEMTALFSMKDVMSINLKFVIVMGVLGVPPGVKLRVVRTTFRKLSGVVWIVINSVALIV